MLNYMDICSIAVMDTNKMSSVYIVTFERFKEVHIPSQLEHWGCKTLDVNAPAQHPIRGLEANNAAI